MASQIFNEGMPHALVAPMYDNGYAIQTAAVDPDFAAGLFTELKNNNKYDVGDARNGSGPGVEHDSEILKQLDRMPRLGEYLLALNQAITDVSGYDRDHLTYLTVRACPVNAMSTNIHRNDKRAGPWLVTLTVAGSGSFNIYSDSVISKGQEIGLKGDASDPKPLASSNMGVGDAWGIYSKEWSAPHAGGPNTSPDPKVLVMLYGWGVRNEYPDRQSQLQPSQKQLPTRDPISAAPTAAT